MNDDLSSAERNRRLSETESTPSLREVSPKSPTTKRGEKRQLSQPVAEPRQLKIVLQVAPLVARPSAPSDAPKMEGLVSASPVLNPSSSVEAKASVEPSPEVAGQKLRTAAEPQQIPARMLNEFVYCQRLFYYEFVEGVFVESADTLRGGAIHQRVDSGNGALPAAKKKAKAADDE